MRWTERESRFGARTDYQNNDTATKLHIELYRALVVTFGYMDPGRFRQKPQLATPVLAAGDCVVTFLYANIWYTCIFPPMRRRFRKLKEIDEIYVSES